MRSIAAFTHLFSVEKTSKVGLPGLPPLPASTAKDNVSLMFYISEQLDHPISPAAPRATSNDPWRRREPTGLVEHSNCHSQGLTMTHQDPFRGGGLCLNTPRGHRSPILNCGVRRDHVEVVGGVCGECRDRGGRGGCQLSANNTFDTGDIEY